MRSIKRKSERGVLKPTIKIRSYAMSNKSVSPNPSKIGIFLGEKCRDCDLPTKSRRAGTKSGRTKNPYSFPSGFAQKSEYDRPGKDLPTRFRVSSVLTFAVLAISVVEYSGISEMLDGKLARYLSCSAWPMASVLVFYGGYPLFRNVWKGGEDGGNAMESLMAVGVLPAYFCSLFRMIDGEELLYFDTVSILVFMFLFARLVETHVRRKVTNCVGERRSFGHGEARLASQDRMRWTGFEALLLGETLLGETLCGKSKSEDLAERWCRGLAPLVPLLAGCAIVVSYVAGNNLDESLFRAVAVSTVACPFALCVSIPLAKAAALGSGRSMGVLIRSQDALKRVKSLDTIVIAKTGGVTEGRFELIRIHAFSSDDSGILERLSSVESNSDHPLAREIVRHAEKEGVRSEKAKNFGCFEGMGVCGMYRGDEISVGNRAFMKRQGLSPVPPYLDNLAHSYERSGTTAVFFGWGSRVQGFVALEDPVGTKAGEAVAKLQKRGLEVLLVSGDSVETTRAVARELKIARFAGGLSQEQKAEAVWECRRKVREWEWSVTGSATRRR